MLLMTCTCLAMQLRYIAQHLLHSQAAIGNQTHESYIAGVHVQIMYKCRGGEQYVTFSGVALTSSLRPGSFALGLSRTKAYSQSCRARRVQFSPVKAGSIIIAYFMIAGTALCSEPTQDNRKDDIIGSIQSLPGWRLQAPLAGTVKIYRRRILTVWLCRASPQQC